MTATDIRKELEKLFHGAPVDDVRLKLDILAVLIKLIELDARLRALETYTPRPPRE